MARNIDFSLATVLAARFTLVPGISQDKRPLNVHCSTRFFIVFQAELPLVECILVLLFLQLAFLPYKLFYKFYHFCLLKQKLST